MKPGLSPWQWWVPGGSGSPCARALAAMVRSTVVVVELSSSTGRSARRAGGVGSQGFRVEPRSGMGVSSQRAGGVRGGVSSWSCEAAAQGSLPEGLVGSGVGFPCGAAKRRRGAVCPKGWWGWSARRAGGVGWWCSLLLRAFVFYNMHMQGQALARPSSAGERLQ